MRRLPSEMLTFDADDGDKVHEHDAAHIVDAIEQEHLEKWGEVKKREPRPDPMEADDVLEDLEDWRLTQQHIDVIRLRVMSAWAKTQTNFLAQGHAVDWNYKHLWFPENDLRIYEMRDGNAPPDSSRPQHLRGMELAIDIRDPGVVSRLLKRVRDDAGIEQPLRMVRPKRIVSPYEI